MSIKLRQLARVSHVDEVVVDSNDPVALRFAEAARSWWPSDKTLSIRARPEHLGQSSTTTDELIDYALSTLDCDILLWTHATSPMVDARVYERAIDCYFHLDGAYDSLMSVHPLQAFLWSEEGPANYSRSRTKWPRTQDIPRLYEVDSGIFLVPLPVARQHNDRIGLRPKLFELSKKEAIDVDWEEDFQLAELLYQMNHDHA